MTSRKEAKDKRRRELLEAAAEIMANKGFHQARLSDVGAAVGISGPALYRYFSSKEDLLAEMLIDISIRLVDGAREIVEKHQGSEGEEADPVQVLQALVDFHVEIAVTEPNLIRVQQREINNLDGNSAEKVKSLQRTYLGIWTDLLLSARPSLGRKAARLRTQFAAGLVNSSRFVIHWSGPDLIREHAGVMAMGALLAD
ncbi:TetR/AcrR family transcriptional regulator [Corynebacterium breve]|uniref:TetR/AcrR family transcriptional regulator n=1 Tax=Corynebacterium breve TaxID=3049799 RepID=A0ABY8VJI6_9CORY|nr:TetR/AcrR family transcriptional regulator [Corynebacterium breve]WIM68388.1 TetR/AcrR family transcriptional regulator [Corynebacterium breve]